MKFHDDIRNIFKLQSGHDVVTDRQTDGENMSPYRKGRKSAADIALPGLSPVTLKAPVQI